MNSLSGGEIESFSREAFLLKTDEVEVALLTGRAVSVYNEK